MQSETNIPGYYMIYTIVLIYLSYKAGNYAQSKGRSFWLNFVASIVLSPIPIFITLKFSKFKNFHNYLDEIKEDIKKWTVLIVLFFLPVLFLLFLYPSKHNYKTLDIIKKDIPELTSFVTKDGEAIQLENQLTVLGFLGATPTEDAILALNLKELVYDKFRGFKRFQIVILVPESAKAQVELLEKELNQYEFLEYWKFGFGSDADILVAHQSLKISTVLNSNLRTSEVFIIDKERHQRGRLDDRDKTQIKNKVTPYGMSSYDCLEVSVLKNKMSEDMRILFTEYRQKRKGNFNSTSRRADDLKGDEKN